MKYDVNTVSEYIDALPEERQKIVDHLRRIFLRALPSGFEEELMYGMITYVVPLSRYPKGYLNKEDNPLPFISLASQKNHIAIYHMAIYMDDELLQWAKETYKEQTGKKIDMGKSCIRFKDMDNIPYDFVEEMVQKMSVVEYINLVEKNN